MDSLEQDVPQPRSREALSELVHAIYAASAQPKGWNDVVAAIAESMGATKGLLLTPFVGPQNGGLLFPWNISESELQLWATRYMKHDIWSARALELGMWVEGTVAVDVDLVDTEVLHNSVFYKEFLSQIGIEWWCGGIVFEAGPGMPHTSLSFFRGPDAQPFNDDDKAWIKLLVPHLSRSLGLMQRFKAIEIQAESMRAGLDRLVFGVALLNEHRQVLHLNSAAHTVLGRNDGLFLTSERALDARSSKGWSRLQNWLEADDVAAVRASSHFSDGFLVPRKEPGHHYLVQYSVVAQTGDLSYGGDSVRYVVFITDPSATRLPGVERVTGLYGLTIAEARVALKLAAGQSPEDIAGELEVAISTIRTHLQNAYSKMHVNRSADLIRAILSLGEVSV